jgi:hypothetical protein
MLRWMSAGIVGLIVADLTGAAQPADTLELLRAVYATAPQDYPSSKDFAQPDRTVPFRWHFYHDGAVARGDKAKMATHVDPYNPLEGDGVSADPKSGIKLTFVAEHVTQGKQALRVDFPAAAIQAGKATIQLKGVAGGKSFSEYLRARGMFPTASSFGPHYRWIKLDVFHPGKSDLRIRLAGVPMVLHPGVNVVAVKTTDAVDRGYACLFSSLSLQVTAPAEDVTLFVDNVRMEQELPGLIGQRGRMFQFPARAEATDPPLLWPGFTAVETDTLYSPERKYGWLKPRTKRTYGGHSFRSNENGLLWGHCASIDSPFRVDLPNGKYGLWVLAAPTRPVAWTTGIVVKLNGAEAVLLPPQTPGDVRRRALGGEEVDYRPGLCVWESLVRPAYYPPLRVVYGTVTDGQLVIEFPDTVALHALVLFPAEIDGPALDELVRLNYLMAESWDVSHPWVKAGYAERIRYMGLHEEMLRPEIIPDRLKALSLTARDCERGFLLFQRGLTEAVYPDTIPIPVEAGFKELRCFAAPGQHACVTLGLLPLRPMQGLRITAAELTGTDHARIGTGQLDLRLAREHQKTMQFGHHNHDYNYQEHYLVRRPAVDLYPGAARRAYLDIAVPADASPGTYTGKIDIRAVDGSLLVSVPVVVEVLPIALQTPPVYFASSLAHPRLKEYGFNAFHASYDDARQNGYRAYIVNLGHTAVPFEGKPIGWSSFQANKELLAPIITAGKAGKAPRGFFGGPAPNTHANPKAAAISQEFFDQIARDFPRIDLLGRSMPAYFFREGKAGFQTPHEWIVLAGGPTKDDPASMEADRKAGREFWYIDGVRHSKEQAARFTFGFWLWRSGATGRFTTLMAHLQYGGGTARLSYAHEPYFTLLDVTTCNVDKALKEGVVEGELNPCRDLVLLREGIDDYRYIHTLELLLKQAESKKLQSPAVEAARQFRDALFAELSPDLAKYYEARSGAYGENWYALRENPWQAAKFDQVRRQVAMHIQAVQRELAK